MPSIEIIAINQSHPFDTTHLPFAVLADTALRSHRIPSRFQSDFDTLTGTLYHLGNPDLKIDHANRIYFAYKLLTDLSKARTILEFAPAFRPALEEFLSALIADSPTHQLIFTSDWQFGPEWTKHESPLDLHEFWQLHDSQRLTLNALYPIIKK